ncbi:MAG: siphovirus Gp157 family protein [Bryobacteraceae bacterium]|nr:siphovirus Gp157 family protein [Bryobacteraceae bacterium]
MAAALVIAAPQESTLDLAERLVAALRESSDDRAADIVDALRSRLLKRTPRDPRSLFELDDRLIDLMDRAEEAEEAPGAVPDELIQEINDYIEAWHGKVDRIAGYWRWQESIAAICGKEAERLTARKKSAEARVNRLRSMLLAFMMSRGLKKLEGEKSSIGMQANSSPSLVIDDPLKVPKCFWERQLTFSKTEIEEIAKQLPAGNTRHRLESLLAGSDWQINTSAVRAGFDSGKLTEGARLVRGSHVRVR